MKHNLGASRAPKNWIDAMQSGNIFANVTEQLDNENFLTLFASSKVKIERIISNGQASPAGFWFDQGWTEWVMVLAGSAGLRVEGDVTTRVLRAGDYVELPAHTRHRIDWTDADQPTIWLAMHLSDCVNG